MTFGSFFGRQQKSTSSESASARVLMEVVRFCPRCGLPLAGHEYRLAAATPLGSQELERFEELLSAIRRHDWQRVLTYQRWIGSQPNAEVFCIKCPDQQLSLAMILAPFELDEPYALMHKELIEEPSVFGADLPDADTWHRL
jgi:hypothetical protein